MIMPRGGCRGMLDAVDAVRLARLQSALPDRYHIERLLAWGEGADVYIARDLADGRQVALKVLSPGLSAKIGIERLREEVQRAARLSNPGILSMRDGGDAAGQLWLVLPCVDGESLRDRLERDGKLPLVDALRIAHDVALALDYAHRQGETRCEVEPSRIWLATDGAALLALPERWVTELRSASDAEPWGLPDIKVDHRADIFSLACVLHEMITGTLYDVPRTPVRPVQATHLMRENVPAAVRRVTTKALESHPA